MKKVVRKYKFLWLALLLAFGVWEILQIREQMAAYAVAGYLTHLGH